MSVLKYFLFVICVLIPNTMFAEASFNDELGIEFISNTDFDSGQENVEGDKKKPTNFSSLLGWWKNINSNTRGVTKIFFYKSGSSLKIRVYGSCSPTDCNWGDKTVTPFSPSVSSSSATGFIARYSPGFATKHVNGYRLGNYIYGSFFTVFKDGSNRYNYVGREIFKKS